MGAVPADEADVTPTGRVLVPLQWATVHGPSMVPTLRTGEVVLVRRGGHARVGDVVLAVFADLPGVVVLKRLRSWTPDGRAVLASDNDAAGGDSRTHGPGRVLGRVVLVRRGLRFRRPGTPPL